MIREAISKVVDRQDLSEADMVLVMNEIMSGEATPAQIGSFITALRMKGETIDEIVGAVKVMREKATRIDTGIDTAAGEVLVDIVGTGGDGSGSFNVSTTTSFVVAAAGVPVAKHGNRAVSSHCGAADVIEALGVNLGLSPERVGACVREVGIGFLFAPMMHGAMKYAIGPRREIGIRTLFNILGPMTNPAGANVQLTGMRRAIIVWGVGNLDEMTVTGATHIADGHDGQVTTSIITPEQVGLKTAPFATIRGGRTAAAAAEQVRAVLGGEPGPKLDMVLLNAGTTLMAAGLVPDIRTGIDRARETVRSGAALAKLDQLIAFCRA
jgi:anthranilate phosphoribosyltransferase